jgi:NADPH:quinone reductase-like Zn-dependent oxidoreductase
MFVAEMTAPGIRAIRRAEREERALGRRDVRVAIRAASLNHRDVLVAEGLLPLQYPRIPLSDASGEVTHVGDEVSRVRPGDRVCPVYYQDWISGPIAPAKFKRDRGASCDGVAAEFLVIPEVELVKVPHFLSSAEASTLPCAALTAWSAVMDSGKARPGNRVLIQGTGGVSLFALQFSLMAGAEVIVISSSGEKLERARAMGASFGVNYLERTEWASAILEYTGGAGVDLVIDVAGPSTIEMSMAALADCGTIAQVGVLSGFSMHVPTLPLMTKNARIQGIINGNRDSFEDMIAAIEFHQLRPALDRNFSLEDLPSALEHMKSQSHFGKVTITTA